MMEAVFLIDPAGRTVDAQLLVAAEWVGVATHCGPQNHEVRFVPGGLAHALDPTDRRVLCGADLEGLAVFATDFDADAWAFRCPECSIRASGPRPDGA